MFNHKKSYLSFFIAFILCAGLYACMDFKNEDEKKTEKQIETGSLNTDIIREKKVMKPVKIAMDADPITIDPYEQLSSGTLQNSHLVYDPLLRWTQGMEFEPRLADMWERIDDLTLRFYLKQGVKFHSGNLMTATDVKWTFNRIKKSADFKGIFEPFKEIVIIDDYTIDIVTKKPYALLLNMGTYLFVMDSKFFTGVDKNGNPKDMISKTKPSFAKQYASGTGPYKITYRELGNKTIYTRNEDYWDTESPGNASEIELIPIPDNTKRVSALLNGDVDFMFPVPPESYSTIENAQNLKFRDMNGGRIIMVQLNQKRKSQFKDKRVRNAMVFATNNTLIVEKIMKNTATVAPQMSPRGYAGYNHSLKPRFDLEKARKLMKEAGLKKGFSCTMIAPNDRYVNDELIAKEFVKMMAAINIRVKLKTMPKAKYWNQFDKRVADIQLIGWRSDTDDSSNFSEMMFLCPDAETGIGGFNSGNYCNPMIDELVFKSRTETNLEIRQRYLQKVEQILYDDAAFIPFHWQNHSWASKDTVYFEGVVNSQNLPYLGDLLVY